MRPNDIKGKRFERLIAISPTSEKTPGGNIIWWMECDCGKYLLIPTSNLINGHTKSCGCLQRNLTIKRNTKHGHKINGQASKEYITWQNMKNRCLNPKCKRYKDYGGRGITICKRWKNSFKNFLEDMGHKPEMMTLERKNNDGNYEPKNCTWATYKEQRNNQRKSGEL